MNATGRIVMLAAAVQVSGCTGGAATALGFGPRCDPNLNKEISVAGQFTLFVRGDPLSATAYDSSTSGPLHEYDTCRGIASVNFQVDGDGNGQFTITPLGVGQCQLTVDDGDHCVTSTVVVHDGFGIPSSLQRRIATRSTVSLLPPGP